MRVSQTLVPEEWFKLEVKSVFLISNLSDSSIQMKLYRKLKYIFTLLYCFICGLLDKEFKWSSKILNAKLVIYFFT